MAREEEKPNKPPQQTTTKFPPIIIAKPGGSEPGTTLRMFEEYKGEKKRELQK
jgi:hypothetical protein